MLDMEARIGDGVGQAERARARGQHAFIRKARDCVARSRIAQRQRGLQADVRANAGGFPGSQCQSQEISLLAA
jgi:hypothetical protein